MKFRSGARVASVSLLVLLTFVVFLIVALMYVDPVQFKGQIEALAQKKGIDLELNGDVSWDLYPNIQLIVSGANASSQEGASAHFNAEIDYFAFAIKPLAAMRGQLDFVGAEISGAEIELTTAAVSSSTDSEENFEQQLAGISSMLPTTAIEKLQLSDIRIQANDGEGGKRTIYIESLNAENARSDGEPFSVDGDITVAHASGNAQRIQAKGFLTLDPMREVYVADFGQLAISNGGGNGKGAQIQMDGNSRLYMNLGSNQWSWEGMMGDSSTVGISGNFSGAISPMNGEGRLEANITDVRALLAQLGSTADVIDGALGLLAIDSDVVVSETRIALENLRLRVDGNPARGSVEYPLSEDGQIKAQIHFQDLNLDQYLPAEDANTSVQRSGEDKGSLSWLTSLDDMRVDLSADRLIAFGAALQDVHFLLVAKDGALNINIDPAKLAGGQVVASAKASAIEDGDIQTINIQGSNLDLTELVGNGEDALALEGVLNFNYTGRLENIERPQLLQGLQGIGEISIASLAVASINIEQNLCESAELLGAASTADRVWAKGTQLGDIDMAYAIEDGVMRFQEFDFSYGNMDMLGEGALNLIEFNYDLGLLVEVNGATTSDNGCSVNKYAQGVQLPMQCNGTLGIEEGSSCGLDGDVIERLLVQQVGGQLIEGLLGQLIGDESGSEDTQASELGASEEGGASETDRTRREEIRNILEGLLKDIDK